MWGSKWLINLFIVAFLVILTGLFLPEEYEVERTIEINAPAGNESGKFTHVSARCPRVPAPV